MDNKLDDLFKIINNIKLTIPEIISSDEKYDFEGTCLKFISDIESFDFRKNYDKNGYFDIKRYSELQEMVEIFLDDTKSDVTNECFKKLEKNYNYFAIKATGIISKAAFNSRIEDLKKMQEISERLEETKNKMDNAIQNTMMLIVSFTMVSAGVTAIEHMDKQYVPMLISFIVWISMTIVIFISHQYSKELPKHIKDVYNLMSWVTIIICGASFVLLVLDRVLKIVELN